MLHEDEVTPTEEQVPATMDAEETTKVQNLSEDGAPVTPVSTEEGAEGNTADAPVVAVDEQATAAHEEALRLTGLVEAPLGEDGEPPTTGATAFTFVVSDLPYSIQKVEEDLKSLEHAYEVIPSVRNGDPCHLIRIVIIDGAELPHWFDGTTGIAMDRIVLDPDEATSETED